MSFSDRRTFALGLALLLGGCGFTPVYAPGAAATALQGRIAIDPPADPEGFALVRRLEDRLGRADGAAYRLHADLRLSEDPEGYLADGTISRYALTGQADWTLTRLSDDAVVASGREKSFTSYATTSTTVATIYASRDARRRLMVILADRIVTALQARASTL